MTLFEDITEIHYNAEKRVVGPKELATIEEAFERIAKPPIDCTLVLEWDTLYGITDGLDVEVDTSDFIADPKHVEMEPDRLGKALGTKATVFGQVMGKDTGVLLNPRSVRYDNSIADTSGVVAIEFTEGETHD